MSTNNSILKDMRQALISAHNANNAKAISKDFAAGSGVSEKAYTSWVTWCNSLHHQIAPWVTKFNSSKVTDAELKDIYDKVFPILNQLKKVDDKLFVRDSDVAYLCGKGSTEGKSCNGTVDVQLGQVAFRRKVEIMFGNRLAQNEVLTEDDYDIILKYERAEKNKEKAENRLDGYTDAKGAKVVGLKDQLKEAEATLENVKKALLAMNKDLDAKTIEENEVVVGYVVTVNTLKGDIKSVEGNINKAKETIKKYGKQYKELTAKIHMA